MEKKGGKPLPVGKTEVGRAKARPRSRWSAGRRSERQMGGRRRRERWGGEVCWCASALSGPSEGEAKKEKEKTPKTTPVAVPRGLLRRGEAHEALSGGWPCRRRRPPQEREAVHRAPRVTPLSRLPPPHRPLGYPLGWGIACVVLHHAFVFGVHKERKGGMVGSSSRSPPFPLLPADLSPPSAAAPSGRTGTPYFPHSRHARHGKEKMGMSVTHANAVDVVYWSNIQSKRVSTVERHPPVRVCDSIFSPCHCCPTYSRATRTPQTSLFWCFPSRKASFPTFPLRLCCFFLF